VNEWAQPAMANKESSFFMECSCEKEW